MKRLRAFLVLPVLAVLAIVATVALAAKSPQVPMDGGIIPQFAQPLPVLALPGTPGTIAVADGTQPLTIRMCEFWANVLPPGTFAPGEQPKTRVWGYIQGAACPPNGPDDPALDTFTGPVVLAQRGTPTKVTYLNQLGTTDTTQVLAYKYSTDQTLHWADPLNSGTPMENMCHMMGVPEFGSPCAQNYAGPIPAVPHLHGGVVPADLDGGPDAWFTSDGSYKGPGYYTRNPGSDPANGAVYTYPNQQEAAPIWFHDHTLGATRLNVYAGLAGAWLIADPNQKLPNGLTDYGLMRGATLDATIPLVIQDRRFDQDGQLFFPADSAGEEMAALNPEHPYWNPEFLGDTVLVNGKAWPYLNIEPRRYRFLFLNGSNARTYGLYLENEATQAAGPSMFVIGTDGGYLDKAVRLNPTRGQHLLFMPGERYEVIIDFAGIPAGTNFILRNIANSPYPDGDAVDPMTNGKIMEFRVGSCTSGQCGRTDTSYNPAARPVIRNGLHSIVRLANPINGKLFPWVKVAQTRQLTLNEVMGMGGEEVTDPVTGETVNYEGGPLEILVNNTMWNGIPEDNAVNPSTKRETEIPTEGTTEVWEIVNLTADAHPIHLHLTQFQLLNRQSFDIDAYSEVYEAAFPGGMDHMGMMHDPGQFIPGFGPPLNYNTGNPRALGGNPDVVPFLLGTPQPSKAYEAGWKDTIIVPPGMVTRIVIRFAPTNTPVFSLPAKAAYIFDPSLGTGYVWHCHIIDHEDNEMMRPYTLVPNPKAVRTFIKGRDY